MIDITMPQLGETVVEGTVTRWWKAVGETVAEDEPLFDVSTDKIDTEVTAPASGTLAEIVVAEGQTVDVGVVLARLAVGSDAAAGDAASDAAGDVTSAAAPRRQVLSPAVKHLVSTTGIDPSSVPGSGEGGRVTRRDIERALAAPPAGAVAASDRPAARGPDRPAAPAPDRPAVEQRSTRSTAVPFSAIRRRTAEHMVRSRATSAHALVAIEVDYENVDTVRRAAKEAVRQSDGISLTYLPFLARAVVRALRTFPDLNASVGNDELIVHHDVNLGIAVDLDFQGLVVPVVHDASSLRLRAIARAIAQRADAARAKRLRPDDLAGGTFTLTNVGAYGTLLTMPIINQPQIAILSTDGVKRRPVVVEMDDGSEAIAIHPVGNLALSWDHRAVDGAYAAAFVHEVKTIIETADWASELD